jgi:hypothetical protein
MPSARFLRRSVLILLVIAAAALALSGCATDGISTRYETTEPVARQGKACFAWSFGQGFEGTQVGEVISADGLYIVRIAGEPPKFNDLQGLARLGHEVGHVMNGRHQ